MRDKHSKIKLSEVLDLKGGVEGVGGLQKMNTDKLR